MGKIFTNNLREYILPLILCIPLFFINVRDSHDWGEDFAQYIHQAINITKGVPQTETGVIVDENIPGVHIATRPVGFPLMLAPVYLLFGNSIKAFSIFITFILILCCCALYIFYKTYFNNLISILLVLSFAYNPYTLNFKMEIMSDIPFTLFLVICLIVYSKKGANDMMKYIYIGILVGILISIRTIGIILLAAILIEDLINLYQNRIYSDARINIFIRMAIIFFTSLFIVISIESIFHSSIGGAYIASISFHNFFGVLWMKMGYYFQMFQNYFMSGGGKFPWFALLTQWLIIILTIYGFIMKYRVKVDFIDIFVILYLIALLFYPDIHSGMRFLFPVFPILLYYAATSFMTITIRSTLKRTILTLVLGLFILIPYSFSLANIVKHQNETLKGPQEKESIEAFEYIKNNLPSDAIIAFIKPRALALYTNRQGYIFRQQKPYQLTDRFKNHDDIYLLLNSELQDTSLENAIINYPDQVHLIWGNSKYKLYELKLFLVALSN